MQMIQQQLNRYKQVQVKTATPGELLILLFDALFRNLTDTAVAMREKQRARAGEKIDKAHAILSELAATLDHEKAPELCGNLLGIYTFCMHEIVKANQTQDPEKVDTLLKILTPLREAWIEAVPKAKSGG
jgi:flagellar secretion chaperone FliS